MKEIVETLLIAIVLVIVVVYLFLQGWRATLIPLLAVPVSLIGTFVFFPLFGFTINTLSLFGLVLAIGLVVDDAIVVVEAVERHIEDGLAPKEAALQGHGGNLRTGDRHRAGALRRIHSHGVHPRHHRTAVPAICRDHRDLGDPFGLQRAFAEPGAGRAAAEAQNGKHEGRWQDSSAGSTACSSGQRNGYVRLSGRAASQERVRAWFCWLAFGVAGFWIGGKLPTSFVPDEDQGYFYLNIQLPNAASLQRTEEVTRENREHRVQRCPALKYITGIRRVSACSAWCAASYSASRSSA